MRSIQYIAAILIVAATVARSEEDVLTHSLAFTADAPQISISRRSTPRNYLRLPSLDYVFRFTARCAGRFDPQSLSLSIADSRTSLSAKQLENMPAGIELTMTVPAKQLAPLAIENFCIKPTDDVDAMALSASEPLTVSAAFSAQAALLCVSDDQQKMIYASNPLDITLICDSFAETPE